MRGGAHYPLEICRPLGGTQALRYIDATKPLISEKESLMRARLIVVLTLGVLTTALAGCDKMREVRPDEYNDPRFVGPKGSLLGDNSSEGSNTLTFGTSKERRDAGGGASAGVGVNAYIWRGALDTLSFMPLASADPFGGVIITDWYTPPATSGERFKATAYVLTKELRSDGVKVSIFRQVLQGNQWVDSPVAASTVSEIEDKVLARARRLREQAGGGNG